MDWVGEEILVLKGGGAAPAKTLRATSTSPSWYSYKGRPSPACPLALPANPLPSARLGMDILQHYRSSVPGTAEQAVVHSLIILTVSEGLTVMHDRWYSSTHTDSSQIIRTLEPGAEGKVEQNGRNEEGEKKWRELGV